MDNVFFFLIYNEILFFVYEARRLIEFNIAKTLAFVGFHTDFGYWNDFNK